MIDRILDLDDQPNRQPEQKQEVQPEWKKYSREYVKCKNCFWSEERAVGGYRCYLNPPTVTEHNSTHPTVYENYRCRFFEGMKNENE